MLGLLGKLWHKNWLLRKAAGGPSGLHSGEDLLIVFSETSCILYGSPLCLKSF